MTNNFPKVMTYTKPQAQEAQRRPRSIKKVTRYSICNWQ